MFLIQVRKENNNRLPSASEIFNGTGGDPNDWNNYPHQFEDIERAKAECTSLISSSQYKTVNVRIVEVVCTFQSEIKIQANSKKYS